MDPLTASLDREHPDYANLKLLYQSLDELFEGGHRIIKNRHKYLIRRPGEEESIYQFRTSRITYTNQIATVIQEQVNALSQGNVSIVSDEIPESYKKVIDLFRENWDGSGGDEDELLAALLEGLMLWGRLWVWIDVKGEGSSLASILNGDWQAVAGIFNPLHVINWGDDWVVIRQQFTRAAGPLVEPVTVTEWMVIDNTNITRYESVDRGTVIDTVARQVSVIPHGLGKIPIVRIDVSKLLWTGNQVYLKLIEFLNLENGRYDSAQIASIIQRILTPESLSDEEIQLLRQMAEFGEESPIKTGNPYVLKAQSFKFEESTGSSLKAIKEVLDDVERVIRRMAGLGQVSTDKGYLEQSGQSKRIDRQIQEATLSAYGKVLVQAYQDILQMVLDFAGFPQPELLHVTGLQRFKTENAEDVLALASEIASLLEHEDMARRLTPTAARLFIEQLITSLLPNASPTDLKVIADELNERYENLNLEVDNIESDAINRE